jgi:hypothetical protein
MLLERIEVTIVMQETEAAFNTERGDEAIDCLSNRDSSAPQSFKVAR